MKSLCVYCGSSLGKHPAYKKAAEEFGALLAKNHVTLVYGGGNVGLMGTLADSVLNSGGKVIGVIPHALVEKELSHHQLTELHTVSTMHERKKLMSDLSDGFVALPGGVGTMDELFEIITWAQLRFHTKPIGLLNVEGYFDKLLEFIDQMLDSEFIKPAHLPKIIIENNSDALWGKLMNSLNFSGN